VGEKITSCGLGKRNSAPGGGWERPRSRAGLRARGWLHAREKMGWERGLVAGPTWPGGLGRGGARAGPGMQAAQGGGAMWAAAGRVGGGALGRAGGNDLGRSEKALCARGSGPTGVALGRRGRAGSRARLGCAGRRHGIGPARWAEGGFFPFCFSSFFHFLFSYYQILFTINELHIKWIHTKAKHHTNTNIYFRMMHQSLFL
jgi:hypothetical protein